jgi:hypothetical protein
MTLLTTGRFLPPLHFLFMGFVVTAKNFLGYGIFCKIQPNIERSVTDDTDPF